MAQTVFALVPSFDIAGQFAQSVWHWQFDTAGYASLFHAAEDLVLSWADGAAFARSNALKAILPSKTRILSIKAHAVNMPGGFEYFRAAIAGQVGLRAGGLNASGLAACVVFTPSESVASRGRWFIPGLTDLDCQVGVLTPGYKSAVTTAVNTMFDDLVLTNGGAPTAKHVIWDAKNKIARGATFRLLSDMVGQVRRRQKPA